MKKSVALIVLTSALLVGCRRGVLPTSSGQSITSDTSTSVTSQVPTTSTPSTATGATSASSNTTTSSTQASSSTKPTSSTTSSQSSTSEGGEREGDWFNEHYYYSDLGYYAMGAPKNAANPINLKTTLSEDASSWYNYAFEDDIGDFRFIYRNSCDDGETGHKTSVAWYGNEAGGLKFAQNGNGFGSPKFSHTGAKLEIRIGISQLTNNSEEPKKNKDTAYVYFFDASDNYLGKYTITEGKISSTTSELKFYWTENASSVAYFEFRINALPYKNSQCYNLGVGYCNFKSWERA